jgi:hypothetical protein
LKGKVVLSTFGHHGVHPVLLNFIEKFHSKFKDNDKIVFVMILDDDIATGKQF